MNEKILVIFLVLCVSIIGFGLNGYSEDKPQYGGILRVIRPTFPKVIGYPR